MDGNLLNRIAVPTYPAGAKSLTNLPRSVKEGRHTSFAQVLVQAKDSAAGLRFSAHAQARMGERGMTLTQNELSRIQTAVDKAAHKGAKDAYVLYGETGFVVNVPNRTVITALVNQEDTVVTNIDTVVVVAKAGP